MTLHQNQIEKGLRSRDPVILEQLIDEYHERLFRYLLGLTGNRDAAEDIFQETWLRVLERGRQYKSEYSFQNWLLTIARNLVIDEARRKRIASLDELRDADSGELWEPVADMLSPLESLARDEKDAALAKATRVLPEESRQVYRLRINEHLPLAMISEALNLPLTTVKSRLYRGLTRLHVRLEHCPRERVAH